MRLNKNQSSNRQKRINKERGSETAHRKVKQRKTMTDKKRSKVGQGYQASYSIHW